MKLTFVVPSRNAQANVSLLYASVASQSDPEWRLVFIDDASTDESLTTMRDIASADQRVQVIARPERVFALRNIVETVSTEVKDGIVAIIDGDDQLCNNETVKLIKDAHQQVGMVVWTAHRWDINGMNISKEMPARVNPYQHPWCSSHLRTFDASLLQKVPISNFKDYRGAWFERGYDQALMLPLLSVATGRKYLPEVCYLYNIDSVSIDDRNWAEVKQLKTVNFVRARGFLKE